MSRYSNNKFDLNETIRELDYCIPNKFPYVGQYIAQII